MSRPASQAIHSGHVEYVLGCIGGGIQVDRIPNGTYITDVNNGDK